MSAKDNDPSSQSQTLSPEALRRAFEHPVRRQILRVLNSASAPLTGHRLVQADGLRRDLSSVTYHALVLAEAGAVEVQRNGDDPIRSFSSAVRDDERAAAILAATARADREHLAGGPGRGRD